MIRKVSFRNFKAYRSLDTELEPFTVLVGPNASGKTTLLEGLKMASAAAWSAHGGGQPVVPLSMQSFGISSPVELTISGRWNSIDGQLKAIGEPEKTSEEPDSEELVFSATGEWNGQKLTVPDARHMGQRLALAAPLREFLSAVSSTVVLRFEPRRLAEASYSEDPRASVSPTLGGAARPTRWCAGRFVQRRPAPHECDELLGQPASAPTQSR